MDQAALLRELGNSVEGLLGSLKLYAISARSQSKMVVLYGQTVGAIQTGREPERGLKTLKKIKENFDRLQAQSEQASGDLERQIPRFINLYSRALKSGISQEEIVSATHEYSPRLFETVESNAKKIRTDVSNYALMGDRWQEFVDFLERNERVFDDVRNGAERAGNFLGPSQFLGPHQSLSRLEALVRNNANPVHTPDSLVTFQ